MKRMYKYAMLFILAAVIPLTASIGQEKKNEQKIKVIINDGSGEKTVLDTTFTGENTPHKISLKDGKVIFIGEPGEKMTHILSDGKAEKVFVTVSSDGDGKKEIEKKVIIMSGDSMTWTAKPGEKNVYAYSLSKSAGGKGGGTIIVTPAGTRKDIWVNDEDEGGKVIVIKDGKVIENAGEKTFDIRVETNDNETDVEKTKYVIAKDGFVVTVEGDDEAKAKELMKVIESKLGVNEEGDVKKEVVKEETKKSVKK